MKLLLDAPSSTAQPRLYRRRRRVRGSRRRQSYALACAVRRRHQQRPLSNQSRRVKAEACIARDRKSAETSSATVSAFLFRQGRKQNRSRAMASGSRNRRTNGACCRAFPGPEYDRTSTASRGRRHPAPQKLNRGWCYGIERQPVTQFARRSTCRKPAPYRRLNIAVKLWPHPVQHRWRKPKRTSSRCHPCSIDAELQQPRLLSARLKVAAPSRSHRLFSNGSLPSIRKRPNSGDRDVYTVNRSKCERLVVPVTPADRRTCRFPLPHRRYHRSLAIANAATK